MPNRILRASILTSDRVNALDFPQEVFYRRLMSVVDDFGRFDARPSILRAQCFPLVLDKIREADISRWLAACQKAGLLALYEVDSKPFVELLNLQDQRRAKRSLYPAPPSGRTSSARTCKHMRADENIGAHKRPYSYSDSDTRIPPNPPPGGGAGLNGKAKGPAVGHRTPFEGFWDAWPRSQRKGDKVKCAKHWQRHELDARESLILAGLGRWKASKQWAKNGGEFIPAPLVWLRGSRWESVDIITADAADGVTDAPLATRELTPEEEDLLGGGGS